MTIANVLSISSLILDVLGAILLARSFIMKHPIEAFRDLRCIGVWDFHVTIGARDMLLSWLVQSVEAKVGAELLAVGFLWQSAALLTIPMAATYGWVVLLMVVSGAIAAFFFLQKWFVCYASRQALPFYKQLQSEADVNWQTEIARREMELHEIEVSPHLWIERPLTPVPIDTTLTSNPSGPEQ